MEQMIYYLTTINAAHRTRVAMITVYLTLMGLKSLPQSL